MTNVKLVILYDYYKELLTIKQQNYFESYYFDNLSLGEISDNFKVSRNAVFNGLKTIEEKLVDLEEKLKLYDKSKRIENIVDKKTYEQIKEYI